ncbi:response regulator transcription factor [Sandarakinorhabdus sp.]|uniref:response regulator transcription factor n=1 Tax=Sandarakinorhabdus sp. TaxID=1916663 RepID=UPI00286D9F84|nr:response regulator transcription factor [Sandarakinorhabdus sp.]
MKHCLICDDHPLYAAALAATVAAHWPAVRITAAHDHGQAAIAASAGQPDLCLLDLGMPGATPRVGVAAIRKAAPAARILIVTGTRDAALMQDLLAMGVAGCLAKTATPAMVIAAIDMALAGGTVLPDWLGLPEPGPPRPSLSPRQAEVARLLAAGRPNKDIARTLGVSPSTTKTHVAQLLAILGVTNRTEAAARLLALGLV